MQIELLAVDVHIQIPLFQKLVEFVQVNAALSTVFEMHVLILSDISDHFDPLNFPPLLLDRPLLDLLQKALCLSLKLLFLPF